MRTSGTYSPETGAKRPKGTAASTSGARPSSGAATPESRSALEYLVFPSSPVAAPEDGRSPRRNCLAFTLVEVLIAVGLLAIISTAIYSTWTAILRSSKVGLDAAASVQRTRIAVRNIEDALTGIQSVVANQRYYGFVAENGSDALLSFVARLPKNFPRSGKFGDIDVRRVFFSLESSSGGNYGNRLVMRQSPVMMEMSEDEKNYPMVLARFVEEFRIEFQDPRDGQFVEEWVQTNQLPKVVRFTLKVADSAHARRGSEQEIVRYVNLPSSAVQPQWQRAVVPGQQPLQGVQPGTPGALNNPLQGTPLQQQQPGGIPGGTR